MNRKSCPLTDFRVTQELHWPKNSRIFVTGCNLVAVRKICVTAEMLILRAFPGKVTKLQELQLKTLIYIEKDFTKI